MTTFIDCLNLCTPFKENDPKVRWKNMFFLSTRPRFEELRKQKNTNKKNSEKHKQNLQLQLMLVIIILHFYTCDKGEAQYLAK